MLTLHRQRLTLELYTSLDCPLGLPLPWYSQRPTRILSFHSPFARRYRLPKSV